MKVKMATSCLYVLMDHTFVACIFIYTIERKGIKELLSRYAQIFMHNAHKARNGMIRIIPYSKWVQDFRCLWS